MALFEEINYQRRRFFSQAALTIAATQLGMLAPAAAYRSKFAGKYDAWLITGGVGHNLPQEAPQAFA
jgi:hypothetical protein